MSTFDFATAESKTKMIKQSYDDSFDLTISIPTFDRIKKLKKTIESAVNQSKESYNIIVVNNSEDLDHKIQVREVINQIKYAYISYYENNSNLGMFGNWNMCIALSKTKYCTILNDDDTLKSNFVEIFRKFKINEYLFVSRARIYGDGKPPFFRKLKSLLYSIKHIFQGVRNFEVMPLKKQLKGNSVHASLGVVFDVKEAINIGGYNENHYPAADVEFSTKYANKLGVTYCFKELGKYYHGGAYSSPNVALNCAALEYTRRKNVLINLNLKNSYLIKLGNKINFMHYLSSVKDLNLDISEKLNLIGISEKEVLPILKNNRVAYFMWDFFSLLIYFSKRN